MSLFKKLFDSAFDNRRKTSNKSNSPADTGYYVGVRSVNTWERTLRAQRRRLRRGGKSEGVRIIW